MPSFQDLAGQRFGRWIVVKRDADYRPGHPQWLCLCDCGSQKVVRGSILRSGHSRSCGCLNIDVRRAVCIDRNTTHGQSKTRTYDIWFNMVGRCHNPKARGYHKYGARGVTVCARWRESFERFFSDMGTCPEGMTIDRIKNERGYAPENCRWATQKTQQNNRTNNRVLEFNGERLTIMQWSERIGIGRHTIVDRIRLGWPIEKILSPVKHGRSGKPLAK